MKLTTVLFDLDGTLLPMDQDEFVKGYFGLLAKKLSPLGYEPEKLTAAIWEGVAAAVKNDGSCSNEERFWQRFCGIFGDKALEDKPCFDEFYANEFQQAKAFCGYDPKAAQAVALAKDLGYELVLATNPIFPKISTESRIRWAGLEPRDFRMYTTYENASYCKPNGAYFRQILDELGLKGEECIMVGNDAGEDTPAAELGMRVFLLTDNLINKDGRDISAYPQGGFDELMDYLRRERA